MVVEVVVVLEPNSPGVSTLVSPTGRLGSSSYLVSNGIFSFTTSVLVSSDFVPTLIICFTGSLVISSVALWLVTCPF